MKFNDLQYNYEKNHIKSDNPVVVRTAVWNKSHSSG